MLAQKINYIDSELTTAELVIAARAGDREAFGELVERFQGAIYATVLRRLGDHADAQEVCQDVFVKALEKLYQLQTPEAFGGWLKQIAVRMSINRAVRRAPTVSIEPEALDAVGGEVETPLDTALANERCRQVHDGLSRLGELDRLTLTAFYLRGSTLAEMSDQFEAPLGTIKRRLHVARQRLSRELEALAV